MTNPTPTSIKNFLLESSTDKINWTEVTQSENSFHAIRQAKDLSRDGKYYYRVTNTELNRVLITIKNQEFIYE
jgi:hypothetical protein